MEIGVDTSALYYYVSDPSRFTPEERRIAEKTASKLDKAYAEATVAIPTTVIVELANILHRRYNRAVCAKVISKLYEEEKNRVVAEPADIFQDALILCDRLGVKYTDCVIYLTLIRAGINRIVTADRDFEKFSDITIV
ncbi:type II toxin-antitoxin system VapC family toxin [Candidatus Micrarchaeota archaeon]|nr:type II toxin-antitoxin system VapC family toxin [Candidatus Micrarchaeota archaeon]